MVHFVSLLVQTKVKDEARVPLRFSCQSKHMSLLMIHTGGGLGGRGSVGTMDRMGCISLINMLAIHQLVQERGTGKYFNLSSGRRCKFDTSFRVGVISAKWSRLDREITTGNNSSGDAVI